MKITILTILCGLLAVTAPAQAPDAESEAKLMIELEKVLPRKAPQPGRPAAFDHSVDWNATLGKLGELLARSAGTRVEPQVLFVMANAQFSSGSVTEAKTTFEDLKARFPEHGLVKKVLDPNGLSVVDQAIAACASEITFRQRFGTKKLPGAEIDDSVTVTLHFSAGDVKIRFYKSAAPEHRANFIKLAKERYYDRTRVHRVNPGRYIHLGDPNSRNRDLTSWGRGGPEYSLPSEFSLASHKRGTLTMDRTTGRNRSHGSRFQILLTDQAHLDFGQTAFAEVIEGIDVVEAVSRRSRNQYEAPVEHVFVNGITVTEKPKTDG